MMNSYLITPKYVLGSDSFHIQARDERDAVMMAKAHIKKNDWHSPNGWGVLLEVTTFEDDNT